MTTKEIVVAFLLYFGFTTLGSAILSLSIYGAGGPNSIISATMLALSVGFIGVAIILWKKWEE